MKSKQIFDSNAHSQQERLLAWLKLKPITTVEARKELDVLSPPARVFELRHERDLNIAMHWVDQKNNPGGRKHRVGRYTLMAGSYKRTRTQNTTSNDD